MDCFYGASHRRVAPPRGKALKGSDTLVRPQINAAYKYLLEMSYPASVGRDALVPPPTKRTRCHFERRHSRSREIPYIRNEHNRTRLTPNIRPRRVAAERMFFTYNSSRRIARRRSLEYACPNRRGRAVRSRARNSRGFVRPQQTVSRASSRRRR